MTTPSRPSPLTERPPCPVTEAQLRWAQFHKKNAASAVQSQLQQLYSTPALPSQVEGARSEDGCSTASSRASTARTRRPIISRGRRALLKVSKRRYEQRRVEQQAEQEDDEASEQDTLEDQPEDEALRAIFAEQTLWKKKRQQRKQQRRRRHRLMSTPGGQPLPNNTSTTATQFESAFRAMMMTLAKRQDTPQIQIPKRKWTRPQGVESDFLVLPPPKEHPQVHFGSTPMDRGASWLIHMPRTQPHRSTPRRRERTNNHQDLMNQNNDTEEDGVNGETAHFLERRKLFETPTKEGTNEDEETPEHDREQGDANLSPIAIPQDAMGFVQHFVAQIERAAAVEELISADGKLHKATFAKLVRRYLQQTETGPATTPGTTSTGHKSSNFQSPLALARARRTANHQRAVAPPAVVESPPDGFVRHFLAQIETAAEEESLVTDEGKLNTAVFTQLVARYLAQAADQSLNEQLSLQECHEEKEIVPNDHNELTPRTGVQSAENRVNAFREQFEPQTTAPDEAIKPGIAARLAGSVTNRMSGFMKRLHTDGEDDDSAKDREAVAAFRKTQGERDDNSSLSSFRALPSGLMDVVKTIRGSKPDANGASFDETASLSSSHANHSTAPSSGTEFSAQHLKEIHDRVMEQSGQDHSIIDTDGSEISAAGLDPSVVANLLLSPTLLTKRHQQAIRAIEGRHWEQVKYLMSANPWLAEMSDVKSGQYLLHSLSYYGGGELNINPDTGEAESVRYPPAPEQINTDLVRMFTSAVHKFDQDGNLPLHMAAAAGNYPMVQLLGDRFPSGASVRNEDGMLPLHLAILSSAMRPVSSIGDGPNLSVEIIKTILSYFPAAVAVADNEGNLPIHTAASVLTGEIGVDIVFVLLDEAAKQVASPTGVRFRKKLTVEDMESLSMDTESTAAPTDSSHQGDDAVHCNMVKNDRGETPLMAAIYARVGWEVIESIVCGLGGVDAALDVDANQNNALHLLASKEYADPEAALSVLKVAPAAVAARNVDGILPIEVREWTRMFVVHFETKDLISNFLFVCDVQMACMQMMPHDVIMEFALADLPIDIERRHDVQVVEGRGASWWYLVCDCDDFFVNVVEEIISLCTFPQIQAICSVQGPSGGNLLQRATPFCKSILKESLRFAGRFEFDENLVVFEDSSRGLRVFEAVDFGTAEDAYVEGRDVLLKCYDNRQLFEQEVSILRFPSMCMVSLLLFFVLD